MTYELWHFDTGNAVGEYASLEDAVKVVRYSFQHEISLEGLALLRVEEDGERTLVAEERDLLPLIQDATRRAGPEG